MPLNKTTWDSEKPLIAYKQLLDELTEEWKEPKDSGLPIIIEDENIPHANTVRLQVIWDKWKELLREDRTNIIIEVYKNVYPDSQKEISLALGYDVEEAVNVGLLPYKIECQLKSDDSDNYEKCRQAFLKLGAWERRGQLELRFADREDAKTAYTRLQTQCPGPFWAFVIELNVEDRLNFEQSCEHSCQSSRP